MEFESQSGVKYWFDNKIGIAFPLNPGLEKYLKKNSIDIENDSYLGTDDDIAFNSGFIKKMRKIHQLSAAEPQRSISPEEVKRSILRYGLLQMTLCVTEDCNLSCKYCYFSDCYKLSRKPSKRKMDFSTAKSALDYFMSLIKSGTKFNPARVAAIGFYGGEPLLNFNLIKKCVQYLNEKYPNLDFFYSLTTNGTLLDKDKADFLMHHDFSIAISLDGDQKEHDRNRVYRTGKGTFTDVMKNIKPIVDSGYDKCRSVAVFDWKSDLFGLQDFFNRTDVPKLTNVSMPNPDNGCTYYCQFSDKDHINYREMETRAFSGYIDNLQHSPEMNSFFDYIFGIAASKAVYSVPALINTETLFIPYTGSCIPGRKMFVDIDGNYHICERVNPTMPIGNINIGLDFERIAQIMKEYRDHLDLCHKCNMQKLCGKCYYTFEKEGQFLDASRICKDTDISPKRDLSRAFTIGEKDPQLLEFMINDYYSMISRFSKTMGD